MYIDFTHVAASTSLALQLMTPLTTTILGSGFIFSTLYTNVHSNGLLTSNH